MGVPAQVNSLFTEFKTSYAKDATSADCDKLCGKLKLEIAKVGNQLLLGTQDKAVLQLARETYEMAAFMSIKKGEDEAFERNVKQLKIYYRDFDKQIGVASANEYKILGLNLLALLAADRVGEFHTELELVPQHDSPFIQRPVLLERYLMEGNYAKINQNVAELSSQEHYPIFLAKLQETMRKRILESLEKSTSTVSVAQLQKLLYFKSTAEVHAFMKAQEQTEMTDGDASVRWIQSGDKYVLEADGNQAQISAFDSMENVIGYATEIERIV